MGILGFRECLDGALDLDAPPGEQRLAGFAFNRVNELIGQVAYEHLDDLHVR